MGKTITINQDSLLKIKESMVGTNNVSHTLVCVNEARPEVDKFELGQESDNPPVGGNYTHIEENLDLNVNSSDVDLSSFSKKDELPPSVWDEDGYLNSRIRLRLLDIADDFWEFVNLTWVKPSGIILTGSICNFNWSKFSDIDLHLIVDFDEIDEKTEFVRDYLDSKKNEWNNEHKGLRMLGYQVELYVQNLGEMPESGGIYDLEENDWVKKPNPNDIKSIGLEKFSIKDKAAEIMTIIDDMYDALNSTDDSHEIETIGDDAKYLWKKVKGMRKNSLEKNGESGAGNIVYKVLRRTNYLDKLWKLSTIVYDRYNSIDESKELIREYLDTNYNLPLYKYFKWAKNASDIEKVSDIIYQCSYDTKKYISKMANQVEDFKPLELEINKDDEIFYNDEFVEKVANTIVSNGLKDAFIYYLEVTGDHYELPSWLFMDFNRIVKNEWCIHFGADSDSIAKEGFTGGTEEIEKLAYTGAGQQKPSAGYDFAFPLWEHDVDDNNYGDEAVIFQTSGIEIYHHGDSQNQVIFWGPYAKNFIPIRWNGEYGDWVVEGQDGQILKAGKPSDIAYWAVDNLPQYRKQIMAGKNGYIPMRSVYDQDTHKIKREPYPLYKNESVKKYLTLLKEEWVGDGNSEHNPYKKRWDAERKALKDFVSNYGKLMQSRENGKLYKVYYDKMLSELIGYNYCICIQWDSVEMKPKSVLYIRALDKFTPNIKQVNFDTRGRDNMRGTYDDLAYQQRVESKKKDNVIESVNELGLYHSSYSNFDKFNHKKYMSSGAGSQTFGWGTYLTDSYTIAKDYAEKFILYQFNQFIVAAEPEQYINNAESYGQDVVAEAVKLYKSIVRTRMCFTWGLDNKYNRNFFDYEFETSKEDPSIEYDNALEEYNRYKEIFKKYFSKLAEEVGEEEAENRIKDSFGVSNDKYGYIIKKTKDDYVSEQNHRNAVNNLVKSIINNIWDAADENVKKQSYIYEVEIPDDNGVNYIDYNNPLPQESLKMIENGLMKICKRFDLNLWKTMKKWEELLEYRRNQPNGKEVYDELDKIIGLYTSNGNMEKATSLFLMQCGFDGIKYKAGTIYGLPDGADEGSLNYVIFDSNKIRITSKNLFTDTF